MVENGTENNTTDKIKVTLCFSKDVYDALETLRIKAGKETIADTIAACLRIYQLDHDHD